MPGFWRNYRRPIGLLAVLLLALASAPVAAPAAARAKAPALDPDERAAIVERAARLPRLRSLLVSIGGVLVEEHYFNGTNARSQANLKSASKTLISILVGIAIDRGHLAGSTSLSPTCCRTSWTAPIRSSSQSPSRTC